MRVLVCGSRFSEVGGLRVRAALDTLPITLLIQGGATGVDEAAKRWAQARGIPVMEFPANWTHQGKAAGPIRNAAMLKYGQPELVVAFPGGNGTANMVKLARAAGVPVRMEA